MLLVFAGLVIMVNLFFPPQNHHTDPRNINLMRFPFAVVHVIILQVFIKQTTILHKIQSATQ